MAFAWHLLQVIKPHSWGTHMLIVEGMKAYWTAAGLGPGTWDLDGLRRPGENRQPGRKPGNLEALWDYEKGIGRWAAG